MKELVAISVTVVGFIGLFMPEGLSATYVMCMIKGKLKPVYVEPEIIVSPFKLH